MIAEVIERGRGCETCRVDLDLLVVLGGMEDSLSIGDGASLVVSGTDCIVGPTDRDGELLIFEGCRGQPRPLGRRGEGPGELGSIRALAAWRGDSIVAFGYGQATILSVRDGTGRTFRFDPAVQGFMIATFLGDSQLVVNSDHTHQAQFAVIGAVGERGASFGLPPVIDRRDPRARGRVLGSSPAPHLFWAGATLYQHRLELWSDQGELRRVIDRSPPWFTPYDSASLQRFWTASASVMRPLPSLRAVHETADRLLWVAAAVPATGWRPDSTVTSSRRTAAGELVVRGQSRLDHYDGVLEVLDGESGELMLSIHTDDLWAGFAGDTIVYSRRESAEGIPQLAVYRVDLMR
jgi:hypothetical protein